MKTIKVPKFTKFGILSNINDFENKLRRRSNGAELNIVDFLRL